MQQMIIDILACVGIATILCTACVVWVFLMTPIDTRDHDQYGP